MMPAQARDPIQKDLLMDLRTNRIDLKLDPQKPGAGNRALALGEQLLAYCASQVLAEQGERLLLVPLLRREELGRDKLALDDDPDSPQRALGETEPLESSRQLTPKTLRQEATQRFTALMAATHGYGTTAARSKRFAGVIDTYMKRYRYGAYAHARALMLLGGEQPNDPALAALLASRDLVTLDTPEARRDWLNNDSGLAHWGASENRGKHIRASIQLQQLFELALRVYVRSQGYAEGAADDELGLLLGSTLMLVAALEKSVVKGYRVEVSLDDHGILSVKTPRAVQRIDGQMADALGRAQGDYADLPRLECQALAPQRRLDATRWGAGMDFFVAVRKGASSTREARLDAWSGEQTRARASEDERAHCRQVLTSGLVLKNRAQDMVEHCLEAALGLAGWESLRFQPTQGDRVKVRAGNTLEQTPGFLLAALPRLQVLYCREVAEDHAADAIHQALMRALARHNAFGPEIADEPTEALEHVVVIQHMAQADAHYPVLVVQVPDRVKTQRKADALTSGWFAIGDDAPRRLIGNITAHALAARDWAQERGAGWDADAYTRAKLALYDSDKSGWQALQGLNLSPADIEPLMHSDYRGELGHKLANISRELKYKHRLSRGQSFVLGNAWRPALEEAPGHAGKRFICLYGHSPRGAPARVGVLEYALEDGTLHLGEVATGVYRQTTEARDGLTPTQVSATQLQRAYYCALETCHGDWCVELKHMLGGLSHAGRRLNETLMVYSPDDHTLLIEQHAQADAALLGATWRDFPFTQILRHGPFAEGGECLPNLARSNKGGIAVAQQLTPPPSKHDILLEPADEVVRGIRAFRNAQGNEKRNNPLITWQVLHRQPGERELKPLARPERQAVFQTFIDTLSEDLVKLGSISRTPLPGKLVKLLVRN